MVDHVATSDAIPGGGYNWGTGMRKSGAGVEQNQSGEIVFVDPDFITAYNMTLLSVNGDPVDAHINNQILLNEKALKTFGFKDYGSVVGEKLVVASDTFKVAGVLKNYHWSSLKAPILPNVLAYRKICGSYISVHFQNKDWHQSISQIGELYGSIFPEKPFEYFFLEDFFNRQYQEDRQLHQIVSLFAILSIIIAGLGFWGMASFSIGQRIKEISIRKVLGASFQSIMLLLSKGFLKPIVIAGTVSLPFAFYGATLWLNKFAFKVDQSWDLYIIPMVMLILVSICAISASTIKAALTNPAKNLKVD
ncbi:MAG: FtsX-like permease family protein [Fulvivirga sp.]